MTLTPLLEQLDPTQPISNEHMLGALEEYRKSIQQTPQMYEVAKLNVHDHLAGLGLSRQFRSLIRTTFSPGRLKSRTTRSGGGNGVSAPAIQAAVPKMGTTYQNVIDTFNTNMLWVDPDALEINLAVATAHRLEGNTNRPWLLNTAPPASGKNEIVAMFAKLPQVYNISTITRKTFFSGLDPEDAITGKDGKKVEPSLMMKLRDNILTFRDLGSMLGLHHETKLEIFSQFLEIFDGEKPFRAGNGKELLWTGRISIIAGVTPQIDREFALLSRLGPRFLFLRLLLPDDDAVSRFVSRRKNGWQELLKLQTVDFLGSVDIHEVMIPEHTHNEALIAVSGLVSAGRTHIQRDKEGNVFSSTDKEGSSRMMQQLMNLVIGAALNQGRSETTDHDIRLAVRTALDCLPPARKLILEALSTADLSPNGIRAKTGLTYNNIHHELEALDELKMTTREHDADAHENCHRLMPDIKRRFAILSPYMGSGIVLA